MNGKHTPGPWSFDRDWYRIPTIFGAGGVKVASVEKDAREATPERTANANLIAAAPDLLAALRFALTDPCFSLLGSVTKDEIFAAIARAEGRVP